MALIHGGRLTEASRRYGIAPGDWLDLSTGIAPWSYPVPEVPIHVWARLPEADDGLSAAAAEYYGVAAANITALPGSQFAIRELPWAVAAPSGPARVGVPAVGYAEHARAWAAAGHAVVAYDDLAQLLALVDTLDHAVVISPNNPTGEQAAIDTLIVLADKLARRDGLLLVDAAFADCHGELAMDGLPANTIVLRSLGKFFGLAGLRLGFMMGRGPAIAAVGAQLQPWGVSHPARWIGRRALLDLDWQAEQQRRIADGAHSLTTLLDAYFSRQRIVTMGLFVTVFFDDAEQATAVHEALADQAVLTRLGDNRRWLRFGLPGDAPAATRLVTALDVVVEQGRC
ncbi:Threonine-phosphate decarboxylase protein [Salinisphaera shabanensis E1L3A]|uniref:threonine-phosphate decarboxylase n=1 Tax=Salinisphaera shabanensis E1L3A TaxID=1033802 RepID=U2E4L8_9GAMM|nr:threonine-phosphate decarboxylase CobD [Salinisphaera shabanensis]ERJ18791.1 Threonine-phosphate decarboxylase protein [Salinisphaera shabanensis E1L3A]